MKTRAFFWIILLTSALAYAQQPPSFFDDPSQDKVYLASSRDGLDWAPSAAPVFDQASVPDIFMRLDGTYVMYWVDFTSWNRELHNEFLSFSQSADGKNWSPRKRIMIQGMVTPMASDPCVAELGNGKLRLFYFAPGPDPNGKRVIRSAISASPENISSFTEEKGVRFEGEGITDPDVVQRLNGTWMMYLSHGRETLIAISPDGENFEDTGEIVREGGVPGAALLEDGRVRLFITSPEGIKSLISEDGISFQREPGVRISTTPGESFVADPSVTRTETGRWLMAFKKRRQAF